MNEQSDVEERPAPTPRVERTLISAARIARDHGHSHLGTEHLLLALLEDGDGVAGQVLRSHCRVEAIRSAIETVLASPEYVTGSRQIFR